MLAMNLPSLSRSIVAQYQILYMRLFPSCVEHALLLRRARTLRADKIRPPESKSDSLVRFVGWRFLAPAQGQIDSTGRKTALASILGQTTRLAALEAPEPCPRRGGSRTRLSPRLD